MMCSKHGADVVTVKPIQYRRFLSLIVNPMDARGKQAF